MKKFLLSLSLISVAFAATERPNGGAATNHQLQEARTDFETPPRERQDRSAAEASPSPTRLMREKIADVANQLLQLDFQNAALPPVGALELRKTKWTESIDTFNQQQTLRRQLLQQYAASLLRGTAELNAKLERMRLRELYRNFCTLNRELNIEVDPAGFVLLQEVRRLKADSTKAERLESLLEQRNAEIQRLQMELASTKAELRSKEELLTSERSHASALRQLGTRSHNGSVVSGASHMSLAQADALRRLEELKAQTQPHAEAIVRRR